MNILTASRYTMTVTAAVAVLAACSGGESQLTPLTSTQQSSDSRDRGRSWMSPEAKTKTLLYVSSDAGYVNVYSYPKLALMGTLTGFNSPDGECVDGSGDIFITDQGASDILEYAHGGTSPIATLSDPQETPLGCAIDEQGNLAVTNTPGQNGSGTNGIAWYKGATGSPTQIAGGTTLSRVLFDGFDNHGDLFIDGWNPSGNPQVGMLAVGKNKIKPITLKGATLAYPGGIQGYQHQIIVGDQLNHALYETTKTGSVTHTVSLQLYGGYYTPVCRQGTVNGSTYVCPDADFGAVETFAFPSGGPATHYLRDIDGPEGTAISK